MILITAVCSAVCPERTAGCQAVSDSDEGFEAVARILEARCISCHNVNNAKNGLALDSRQRALKGGKSGEAIIASDSNNSLLLDYIAGPDAEMPPSGESLTKEQFNTIELWIANGAAWPQGRTLAEDHLNDNSWWSFQPLKKCIPPTIVSESPRIADWCNNEIDQFVLDRLLANGLMPAPNADRATLIRRLYFDLIGLPPTPAAIESFVRDSEPDAYERLVDELLASERYGERWARHWLDVVHYGDTHGYDKDKPRSNAWPYRDYVIRSLNEDKSWSQFVQEQIAGDSLYPNERDGIEALGFIAAGPWDFVGHAEVSEDKIDGKIARHLDRDDMVRTTIKSFMGLTIGCAQCHDHKFDPITQADYYQLHAVFAALDRADKPYDLNPETGLLRRGLQLAIANAKEKKADLKSLIENKIKNQLTKIDAAIEDAKAKSVGTSSPAFGYHSQIDARQDAPKWVQVDLGKAIPVRQIVLRPCKDDFNNIGEGFGFPVRFKIELSNDSDFEKAIQLVVDETGNDFANPGLDPVSFSVSGEAARFVRVIATKLAPRKDDYIFALAELEVLGEKGTNHAALAEVTALDSIEAAPRWSRNYLTDGQFIESLAQVEKLQDQRQQLILDAMTEEQRAEWKASDSRVLAAEKKLAALPPQAKVYAGTIHTGSGTFLGTGHVNGQPRPIHLLHRGDVRQPADLMLPSAISVVGLDKHFELEAGHDESQRRAALAKWLTDSENPLTWRNVVNRTWQYHFGTGIVDTPDDFGRMGGQPSHPELLDFLAMRFRDRGQSLKSLHRMIVTSATWRQASSAQASVEMQARELDSGNRLLWKMPRRKLEAEAVRDSVLQISGKLDLSMYGPGFRDFVLKHPEHSPHYEYHLHDPDDPATHRRSIYRFVVRSQLQPFMTSLDCADPSIQVGRRNQSLTPLQSLTMLNSGLMVTMAEHFAVKLAKRHDELDVQIRNGFAEAIGRSPTVAEFQAIRDVAQNHGLANACRLIFNLNEFSFVD